MKRLTFAIMMCAIMVGAIARAGYTWEYTDGKKAEFGADVRIRLTSMDRDVDPEYNSVTDASGPKRQYLRVRERVWGKMELWEGATLTLRLGNRWHDESSSPANPNDQTADPTVANGTPWGFMDEIYVDNLYLDWKNIKDSNFSLRVGRQDIVLGNGMVLLEGTPMDQGRSIYFDGAVGSYQTECDTLLAFALYNDYRDRTGTVIHDRERSLRGGNITVYGTDWTHRFNDAINTEMYYMFADIEDDDAGGADANDAELHIFGGRIFGAPTEQIDYSIEYAQQLGKLAPGTADVDAEGRMVDARLNIKAGEGMALNPKLMLEYTYYSGDDPNSGDFEGWVAAFNNYPIFREELLPTCRAGEVWTNIHQYRAGVALQLMENVKFSTFYAFLMADEAENNTNGNGDDNMGQLLSGFVDWQAMENVTISLEGATFFPGDYYTDGDTSEWLRLQTVIKF